MNNYEWLTNKDLDALGHELCALMEESPLYEDKGCSVCPMYNKCQRGFNGFIEYLKEQKK